MGYKQKRYVVGFAFDYERERVLLIRKTHPEWQAGRWNGIGGRLEPGEHYAQAMVREFREETGIETAERDWHAFAALVGPDFYVRCFRAFTGRVIDARTTGDEQVGLWDLRDLTKFQRGDDRRQPMVDALEYLVPLALDCGHVGVPLFHYRQ